MKENVVGLLNQTWLSRVFLGLYRFVRDTLMILLKLILFLIPKDKNLILANAWFGQRYADNTKYEYEYLLSHSSFKVVWATRNKTVYDQLKENGKPVVLLNSLKGIWTQIRAKMLLSTIQTSDYNKYFLCNCILLDLDHGIIYKKVGFDISPNKYQEIHDRVIKRFVKYYMTATSFLTAQMMKHSYHVSADNTVICGKARLDYFFDEQLRSPRNPIQPLIGDRKAIVYMPTHRSCGQRKLDIHSILDLAYIDRLCAKNNYVFIIKKHFYHKSEKESFDEYANIIDITDSNYETEDILYHASALITDYSSCYIDFFTLDRPLVLYTFDLEDYLSRERGLFVSFDDLDIGYQPRTKEELNRCIDDIITNPVDRYREKRNNAKEIFFDRSLDLEHSRKGICEIIQKMMNGSFQNTYHSALNKDNKTLVHIFDNINTI